MSGRQINTRRLLKITGKLSIKIENKAKVKSGLQIEGSGYKPEPAQAFSHDQGEQKIRPYPGFASYFE
ncbi:MAG: hypothetical protein DWB56_14025 [Candidatus Jettenia sp.]|nr:MAG: hypothetical protein EDM77_13320 [Candidatus Jettenia sp. AMX1]MBC6930052.1 hypothetical protein [Candidatus Jettenia sp.]GIL20860.1 MAG: hypothetical protein BroJett041_19740 [Candidatus Jettenia caeni]MCE7881730.1 hypothetical protein [Candidatus Jettenia sp. AMX1]MCQ3928355.1 hypothetical protein [Candidatus Jettenia sp.]